MPMFVAFDIGAFFDFFIDVARRSFNPVTTPSVRGIQKWSPKFGQGCKVVFALMRGPYEDGKATQFFT